MKTIFTKTVLTISLFVVTSIQSFSQCPDLEIATSPIGWQKSNDTISAYFTYTNSGSAPVNSDYTLALAIKNTSTTTIYTLKNVSAQSLGISIPQNVGDSYNVNLAEYLGDHSNVPNGTYEVIVAVDNNLAISECSETNNAFILNGTFTYSTSGINESKSILSYLGNYPNPVVDVTNLIFTLIEKAHTTLTIYDITGKEIVQLVNKDLSVGTYTLVFDVTTLPNGIYAYSLKVSNEIITKKFIVSKQ